MTVFRSRSGQRAVGDQGSLTVELVVLTPVLVLVALVILMFGRVADARQEVAEAARTGAETASIQPTAVAADQQAEASLDLDLTHVCSNIQVKTDTGQFVPGGLVRVTVVCHVPLSDVAAPGLPGSTTVQATSTAPIDPYRAVEGS